MLRTFRPLLLLAVVAALLPGLDATIGLGPVPISGGAAGTFSSVTDSGLTTGRVPFATTAGLLTDSATLLYDSANAQLKVGDGATANVALILNGPVGARDVRWQTATSNRWIFRIDATAEGGSDAGSNIDLRASNDAGTYIDSPIYINRATGGAVTIGRPITLNNFDLTIATVGKGLKVKEGTNGRMGTATLVAGASTVANTSVSATTRIFLESNADGGTPGWLRVSARVASTSFTITSSSGTDTSTVAWLLVEPSP